MKQLKDIPLDRLLSLSAFIFSLVSLFFTWQGNTLLNDQNEIARQANKAHVVPAAMTGVAFAGMRTYGCHNSADEAGIQVITDAIIGLYNDGARDTSLAAIDAETTNSVFDAQYGFNYSNIIEYGPSTGDEGKYISLPVELPVGTTKHLGFQSIKVMMFPSQEEATNYVNSLSFDSMTRPIGDTTVKAGWKFFFVDGSTLTVTLPIFFNTPSTIEFKRLCR